MTQNAVTGLAPGIREFIAASRLQSDDSDKDANLINASIEAQRLAYNTSCAALAEPRPANVNSRDLTLDLGTRTIRVRAYSTLTESLIYLVWYHGGGFTLGGLESHDSFLAKLCAATAINVVAIDYRLAPEHVYPAALDDCFLATQRIAQGALGDTPSRLLVGGDSAGGNLAAAVCLRARSARDEAGDDANSSLSDGELPLTIAGHILIYPGLSSDFSSDSFRDLWNAPNLSRDDCEAYLRAYAGTRRLPIDDPYFSPLAATDLTGLPPGFVISAAYDPLRDDARAWAQRLIHHGIHVTYLEGHGLVHGFLRAGGFSPTAEQALKQIYLATKTLGEH